MVTSEFLWGVQFKSCCLISVACSSFEKWWSPYSSESIEQFSFLHDKRGSRFGTFCKEQSQQNNLNTMIFKRQENVMQLLKEQSNLRCKLGRCLIDKLANLQYDGNDLHFLLKKDFERGLKKKQVPIYRRRKCPSYHQMISITRWQIIIRI